MSRARLLVPALALVGLGAWPLARGPAAAQTRPASVIANLTIFAGTHEGLWRSPDWGTTWQRVRGGAPGDTLEGLGAAPAVLPYGPRVFVGGEGGLFVSEDFGDTWERLPLSRSVLSLASTRHHYVDPTLLVGTTEGLVRSPDGGRTVLATPIWGTPVHRLVWPGPALIAATGRGVLLSEDSGARFAPPGRGLPRGAVRALATSSFFAIDPVLFAAVEGAGVYHSTDGARTWTATGLDSGSILDLVWLGPFLYATGQGGVFRSEDTGRTWRSLGTELAERTVARLLFPLAPQAGMEAFVATDDGVYRTLDGGEHWQPAGLTGQDVLAIATFPPPEEGPDKKSKR